MARRRSEAGWSATVTLIVCEQDIVAQIHDVRADRNGFEGNAIGPRSTSLILPNADPVSADRVSYDAGFPFHTRLLVRFGRSVVPTVRPIKAAGMVGGAVVSLKVRLWKLLTTSHSYRTNALRLGSKDCAIRVDKKPAASVS